MLPTVSIIIPAYNEEKYILDTLTSLTLQDYPKELIQIIVVDNGSTDKTYEIASGIANEVYIMTEGPVGNVRNYGVSQAKGEILFFLDADCLAPKNWVAEGVNYIVSHGKNSVAAGGLRLKDEPSFLEKYWLLATPEGEMLPSELLGSTLVMSKDIFERVNGFNTTITAGEDSRMHKDLESIGVKVYISREFSVVHLGNATDVLSFIKRQIWHSENYFVDFTSTRSDKVFWLTLIFLISVIGSVISLLFSFKIFCMFIFITLICVILRSLKRISGSRNRKYYNSFHCIMFLDLLYLIGRSLGIMKGIKKRVKKGS